MIAKTAPKLYHNFGACVKSFRATLQYFTLRCLLPTDPKLHRLEQVMTKQYIL